MAWLQGDQGGRSGTPKTSTTPERFKTPTSGLEYVFLKIDMFQDEADFLETKTLLARYAEACNYRGAALALWVMDAMTSPTFDEVVKPNKPNFKDAQNNEVDKTQKELLLLDYSMEIANYIKDVKETNAKKRD